ncbi:hypothetical protein D3C84_1274320 [compost metagenome]
MFDGILLTDEDKEWVERMLTVLFWKQRQAAKLEHPDFDNADKEDESRPIKISEPE